MSRPVVFALIACGLLSACSGKLGGAPVQPAMTDAYSQSIGFTGISGERY